MSLRIVGYASSCACSLAQIEKDDVIDIEEERIKSKRQCAQIYSERLQTFGSQAEKTKVCHFSD